MSIFGKIMSSIFGGPAAASPAPSSGPAATPGGAAPSAQGAPAGSGAAAPSPAAMAKVDVADLMDKLADEADEELDWRKSIVDLMKLLDIDSSLSARRQLADELKFTGDKKDTATMNVWLHKQVIAKLAENGGKVPADLLKH
jgi:Domain of unknown function (DUF3597)